MSRIWANSRRKIKCAARECVSRRRRQANMSQFHRESFPPSDGRVLLCGGCRSPLSQLSRAQRCIHHTAGRHLWLPGAGNDLLSEFIVSAGPDAAQIVKLDVKPRVARTLMS